MSNRIDDTLFASAEELRALCHRIGSAGLRSTASVAHQQTIEWIEGELLALPGITTRSDSFDIDSWAPAGGALIDAGRLFLTVDRSETELPVGGAVPYSRPWAADQPAAAPLVYLPGREEITAANAAGRIVIREFPVPTVPAGALLSNAFYVTPDLDMDPFAIYDSGAFADALTHDLLAAGEAGAAGVIIGFDVPQDQIAGYFEPHAGTHFTVPAVFVGIDEHQRLREAAASSTPARIIIDAQVSSKQTRNLIATLPGTGSERIVLVTHTDGNTWVQDNGAAAMIALARYFSTVPLEQRARTIEFAFTSAHLHMSREGSARYAAQLDAQYDDGSIAFVFPIEHLGTREIARTPRPEGQPGNAFTFTGRSEPILWAVGPSPLLRETVTATVQDRNLDRVIVTAGIGIPDPTRVPAINSFGGLGTIYNMHLLPTTAIISGPWSLWAPSFGEDAIDVDRMRRQVLAIGDVVAALDSAPQEQIAGDILGDRRDRDGGKPNWIEPRPSQHVR